MPHILAGFILTFCAAAATAQVAAPNAFPGDLNADRSVDTADLRVMVELLVGEKRSALERLRADLNRDGRIDSHDLATLVEIVDGQRGRGNCDSSSPCCSWPPPIGCCDIGNAWCSSDTGGPPEGEGPGGIGGGGGGDVGGGGTVGGGGGPGDPPDENEPDPPGPNNPCTYVLCVIDAEQQFVPAPNPLEAVDGVTLYAVRDPTGANPTLVEVEWYLLDQFNQPIADPAASDASSYTLTPDGPGRYQLGTRCDDPKIERGVLDVAIFDLHVKSVTFGGGNHVIFPDNPDDPEPYNEPYEDHHWYDANADGDTDDAIDDPGANHDFARERDLPVAYTRNTPMTIQSFEPWYDSGVAPSGGPNPGPKDIVFRAVHDRGGANEMLLEGSNAMPAVATRNLPDHIDHDIYQLAWDVSFDQGVTWFPIGNTTHEVYVTLATPTGQRLESMYHIAITNALNQTTAQGALSATWAKFATRSVQNKRGDTLGYYRDVAGNECNNALDASGQQIIIARKLLNETNGQCGAWLELFGNVLRIHGIAGQGLSIVPDPDFFGYNCADLETEWRANLRMLIQTWTFIASAHSGCLAFPYRINHSCLNEWPTWTPPDVVPGSGVVGQDSFNPRSVFIVHYVFQHDETGLLFDPSYGTGPFADAQAWEDASIAGFATTINLHAISRLRGAMKHVPSVPHVITGSFTISEVAQ